MARVICKLENASEEISGVKFEETKGGMLSEDISDELAARFASVKGYELVDDDKPAGKAETKAEAKARAKAEAEAQAKAEEEAAAAAAAGADGSGAADGDRQ